MCLIKYLKEHFYSVYCVTRRQMVLYMFGYNKHWQNTVVGSINLYYKDGGGVKRHKVCVTKFMDSSLLNIKKSNFDSVILSCVIILLIFADKGKVYTFPLKIFSL